MEHYQGTDYAIKNKIFKYFTSLQILPSVLLQVVIGYWFQSGMDGFTQLEKIAQGAHGTIYKVKDLSGDIYAMKTRICLSDTLLAVQEEYKSLEKLNSCPNISHVHGAFVSEIDFCGQKEKIWCVIMDFCDCGDLSQFLARTKNRGSLTGNGPLEDELLIISYVLQLAKGAMAMHNLKIIHRDIKPANIFLTNSLQCLCIGDFSIASNKTLASTAIGTPLYFAPEIFVMEGKKYGGSVDMWSIGCVTLDLLTLLDPVLNQRQRIGSIPKSYSSRWQDIVNRLLDENPETRLTAPQLMDEVLQLKDSLFPALESATPREPEMESNKESKYDSLPSSQEPELAEPRVENCSLDVKKSSKDSAAQDRLRPRKFPLEKVPRWKNTKSRELSTRLKEADPCALCTDEKRLFICNESSSDGAVFSFLLHGKSTKLQYAFARPTALDFVEQWLYILDTQSVIAFHKGEMKETRVVKLPSAGGVGLKVDLDGSIYVTIKGHHTIFIYSPEKKKMSARFGSKGTEKGHFQSPWGLALDRDYLYVCDSENHRVQVLQKDSGKFVATWGEKGIDKCQFLNPCSIYLHKPRETKGIVLLFVGDQRSVQILSKDGEFVQRLGGDKLEGHVSGICVMGPDVYVAYRRNARIHVFKRQEGGFPVRNG